MKFMSFCFLFCQEVEYLEHTLTAMEAAASVPSSPWWTVFPRTASQIQCLLQLTAINNIKDSTGNWKHCYVKSEFNRTFQKEHGRLEANRNADSEGS